MVEDFCKKLFGEEYVTISNGLMFVDTGWLKIQDVESRLEKLLKGEKE